MRTKARSTRLASILLPAFLYLGCTGEGITGPAADDRALEESDQAAADDTGHGTPREPVPDDSEDPCVYWGEEMFCPNPIGTSDGLDVE